MIYHFILNNKIMDKKIDDITSKFLDKFIELEKFISGIVLWNKEAKEYLSKLGDYYDETRHEGFVSKLWTIKKWNYNISRIIKNWKWFDRLTKYSHIRNKLLHDYKWFISISESACNELESDLNVLRNPKKIWEVRKCDVFTCNNEDKLEYVLKEMKDNLYTHIPVLNNEGNIKWVLSESTILYFMLNNIDKDRCLVMEPIKIWDIDLVNSNDEYKIISKDVSIYDIDYMFLESINLWIRLGVIIITNNWNTNWNIEWVITAWDIPMIKKHYKN